MFRKDGHDSVVHLNFAIRGLFNDERDTYTNVDYKVVKFASVSAWHDISAKVSKDIMNKGKHFTINATDRELREMALKLYNKHSKRL